MSSFFPTSNCNSILYIIKEYAIHASYSKLYNHGCEVLKLFFVYVILGMFDELEEKFNLEKKELVT